MSTNTIFIIIVGALFLVIGLIALLASSKPNAAKIQGQPAIAYSAGDTDRPKAETQQVFSDLGEIKVTDVKQVDYQLKNTGTKPLQILNINSSCGCTAGQIIYKEFTSDEFSMHTQSGYVTEIAPGDTGIVRLTYRPATMPVYGIVEREVYITTNDPANQRLVFGIKAKVK